jgi:UDP-GlcNAc3NAcA epimerase
MKLVTIVGARPQFIKAAVVSRAIRLSNKHVTSDTSLINEVIIHSGQHYERNMSDIFFEEMGIPQPNYDLAINSLSHGAMTGQMLEELEGVLIKEKPDVVLVYGDTNTTLAGALAAAKLHIPVAHVEAGLRSYNRRMPEEINRVLTDHIANILFCPTQQSVENLKAEGIGNMSSTAASCELQQKVALVGDVMFDAVLYYKAFARKPDLDLPAEFILATIHRAENTDNFIRLKSIFNGFEMISKEIPIILPLHPRTRKTLDASDLKIANLNIIITEPVGYLEMMYLLENCRLVMTDSGGLQKEAFFFKKPCITLRDETEWVELAEHGYNLVCGADTEKIFAAFVELRDQRHSFNATLYGDGKAGEKIVRILFSL